jgi:hypothetical protein
VRTKAPRPWGRTSRFVRPLDPQPQTIVEWDHHQRHVRTKTPPPWGRTSRFVLPLRAHPQQRVPWATPNAGRLRHSLAHATTSRAGARFHHSTPPPPAWEKRGKRRTPGKAPTSPTTPPKNSPLYSLLSPLSASGRASAGWWKRPLWIRLPLSNKTPPTSRRLVNQICG